MMAAKAARGAGAPPEQAAEFGKAALMHLIAGRPAEDIETALAALPTGPILDLPVAIRRTLETAQEATATLLLPKEPPAPLFLSYLEAQPFAVERAGEDQIVLHLKVPAAPMSILRVHPPNWLWAQMSDLARQILVPDTAASRAAGAGAGQIDND